MIQLSISYSKDFELERIKSTVFKLPWYNEQGYRVTLPQASAENPTELDYIQALDKEYDIEIFEFYKKNLNDFWESFIPKLEAVAQKKEIIFPATISVILTKYGTGGSYDAILNEIILNIQNRPINSVGATLVHEIVHISIQLFIQSYSISHWKKERIVDLLVEHYFPGLRAVQIITEDVSSADKAFKKFDGNIENMIQNVNHN